MNSLIKRGDKLLAEVTDVETQHQGGGLVGGTFRLVAGSLGDLAVEPFDLHEDAGRVRSGCQVCLGSTKDQVLFSFRVPLPPGATGWSPYTPFGVNPDPRYYSPFKPSKSESSLKI